MQEIINIKHFTIGAEIDVKIKQFGDFIEMDGYQAISDIMFRTIYITFGTLAKILATPKKEDYGWKIAFPMSAERQTLYNKLWNIHLVV